MTLIVAAAAFLAAAAPGPALDMTAFFTGRTLSNHVVVRKFGLKLASVDGHIRKLD